MLELGIGIALGTIMFVAKWCSLLLLTGGKDGVSVPFIGKVFIYDWIMGSLVRRGMIDLILGSMVAHLFMGSVIGMIGAITFATISMAFLMSDIILMWIKNKYNTTKEKLCGCLNI